jgi:hypothetical protein
MSPPVIPRASRSFGGREAWVIDAGCSLHVSTPPRLSAREGDELLLTAGVGAVDPQGHGPPCIHAGGIKVEGAQLDATRYSPFRQNGNFPTLRKIRS